MSYSANSYNYATPLSSAPGFIGGNVVDDIKYFTLLDNVLDGTCYPISGDVGLWSNTISDADGLLPDPFTITVDGEATINTFVLVGSSYSYPVAFTVAFYNNDSLVHTIREEANDKVAYTYKWPSALNITSYIIYVYKISASNRTAIVHSAYLPLYIAASDTLSVHASGTSKIGEAWWLTRSDRVSIGLSEYNKPVTVHVSTFDTLATGLLNEVDAGASTLSNIHSVMKQPSRRIYGKVFITYNDPMLDTETLTFTNTEAHNSVREHCVDGVTLSDEKFFTLYDNDLTGAYTAIGDKTQVGWVSDVISDANGRFEVPPYLKVTFAARPIITMTLHFDAIHENIAEDFDIVFTTASGESISKSFTGNRSSEVLVNSDTIANVVSVLVTIHKVITPFHPASIVEVPLMSTILYEGTADTSNIVSIDLLEELTYDDDIEALGGVSANEVNVVLDNSDHAFYPNNTRSAVAGQLRRNRKIEPWLGAEIAPGIIEWYKQGTFWSYRWEVPVGGLVARVVGFDTIGLLSNTDFVDHATLMNKSIGQLLDYVLLDAKKFFSFLTWQIDPALYDVIIPYAWFEHSSHAAALRKISSAYPMHIYCDRNGVIKALRQKLHVEYYHDIWSDSTNVVSKKYNSLYTALPNIINVTLNVPQVLVDSSLIVDNLEFDIAYMPERCLNFSSPYISDLAVEVSKDASVEYSYTAYSWGILFKFTGEGKVYSIKCSGSAVDISNTAIITRRNDNSVLVNGAITRDISSDFIQTYELAYEIANRIYDLSEQDKYDVSVVYRGDIALSINDSIRLLEGIAPDNRYTIRRHKLYWNGALSGTADLNT